MKAKAFLSEFICVRSIWLLCIVLMLSSSATFALDPLGPAIADLGQGQFRDGFEYSYGSMDFKLNEGKWDEYLSGVFFDSGKANSITVKDFKTKKSYFNLRYGITDNVDAFVRLGATIGKFGDSIWDDAEEFNSQAEFTIGGGIQATFYEDNNLRLGGLFQAGWANYDGKLMAKHWAAADFIEMNITEIQVAVGPTYKLMDRVLIYGGPFFHFINGDLDDEYSEVSGENILTSYYSWDVDERSIFGGYIGMQIELAENSSLNFEYQYTASADLISVGLIWRF